MTSTEKIDSILKNFKEYTCKPEYFLEENEILSDNVKRSLKECYDLSKSEEIKSIKTNSLPELIVENFDQEQIWQQIELQNDSLLTRSLINVSKLIVNKDKLLFKNLENDLNHLDNENSDVEDELIENEEDDKSDISSNDFSDKNSENEFTDNFEKTESGKSSIVDDGFFKLNEMEKFLKMEENKLNEPDSGNDSEDSNEDDAESINLFEDNSDGEDDKIKTAKYKDFFVETTVDKPIKRNKFLSNFSDDDNDEENTNKATKSSLELRQERLKQKIEKLEENAVSEKPWQLKGEITAEGRPQNSLLEEIVEFDITSRPAPVITEQTSMKLEDIIRQRIKDKVFDSVERKIKPMETPLEYKKKLVLNQEKSKESLAQIYEKEFLAQQAALDPEHDNKEEEEPALHKEIKSLMTSLFNKLDALSNFHFTPKPAIPELKIVSNLPAINMEEVAPVAASEATLLAPEEIKNKTKGDIMGKSERTRTDKNRERRKKKLKQKQHVKEKQRLDGVNKSSKNINNKKLLEKVTKLKNTEKMEETSGKSVRSSQAFFSQLEDEVHSHINKKVKSQKKFKEKNKLDAKKIKL